MYTMVTATVFHGRRLINKIHPITTATKEHHLSNVFHPVSIKQCHLRWVYSGQLHDSNHNQTEDRTCVSTWSVRHCELNETRNCVITLGDLSLTMLCFDVGQKSWWKERWHLMTPHLSVAEKIIMAIIKCNCCWRSSGYYLYSTTRKNIQKSYIWPRQCIYVTFRGPCIMVYSYNQSQRDALFLKNFKYSLKVVFMLAWSGPR